MAKTKKKQKKPSSWFQGIDVSHYQGRIDWKRVARSGDVRFVYIKATQGATIVDDRYKYNNTHARRHGILCGAYLYFSSSSSVQAQFDAFKRVAKKSQQDLRPVIDVEREAMRHWSQKEVRRNLKKIIQLMTDYYGKSPVIYSQYKYYNECLAPTFNRYYLFLAKYSKGCPRIRGKGKVNIWQFTERGMINGIPTRVDLNRCVNGMTVEKLKL
jgi:lysozyme